MRRLLCTLGLHDWQFIRSHLAVCLRPECVALNVRGAKGREQLQRLLAFVRAEEWRGTRRRHCGPANDELHKGARVRVLVSGSGEVEGQGEVHYPAGALGTVDRLDLYDNDQGVVVTVVMDCGVVNAFDHLDGPLGRLMWMLPERREPAHA